MQRWRRCGFDENNKLKDSRKNVDNINKKIIANAHRLMSKPKKHGSQQIYEWDVFKTA